MDRYHRVEKPREEAPISENEIRITTQGRMRSYITYASSLLQEKESNEIIFKAMGRAINKTVMIVELIKRRIVGLHQNTAIGSTDITDTWEPLEEGLLPLETTRHVSLITITLSKKELDKSLIGYQSPLPADQVKPYTEFYYERENSSGRGRGRDGRGRGRGRGRESGPAMVDYNDGNWDTRGHGYGRGDFRGRGRGRGFRGRGRGNYGERFDYQHDSVGYNEEAPAAVQGRESEPEMVDYNVGSWDTRGRGYGRGGFRGRGRGNYGEHFDYQHDSGGYNEEAPAAVQGRESGPEMVDDGSWDARGRGNGRGGFRGNGRGRGFRGRGRGNYGDHFDYQHDSGGYIEEAPAAVQGRGRGRGGRNRGRGRDARSYGPIHADPGEAN